MIDEKKLVEFIKSDDFIKTIIRGKESLKDIIIQLIKEQPKVGEWVPVKDRFPERYVNVLVNWRMYLSDDYFIDILYLNENNEFVNDFGKINGKPIAWMPLPKTYRGDI